MPGGPGRQGPSGWQVDSFCLSRCRIRSGARVPWPGGPLNPPGLGLLSLPAAAAFWVAATASAPSATAFSGSVTPFSAPVTMTDPEKPLQFRVHGPRCQGKPQQRGEMPLRPRRKPPQLPEKAEPPWFLPLRHVTMTQQSQLERRLAGTRAPLRQRQNRQVGGLLPRVFPPAQAPPPGAASFPEPVRGPPSSAGSASYVDTGPRSRACRCFLACLHFPDSCMCSS